MNTENMWLAVRAGVCRIVAVLCVASFYFPTLSGTSISPLPEGHVPPGKTLMVIQPHHDDHTWQYGFGGLIAKMTEAGYKGVYVRVSNDEKDGGMQNGWGANDISNYEDTLDATKNLGLGEVISLNWRNDHMSSIPHIELRDQIILLIRKHRPDVVMSYHPWGNYDRNPDHRKVSWAVGSAVWLAGFANVRRDHAKLGLEPYQVPHKYYSHRSDYGRGYHPNIFVELSEDDVARKAKSYRLHKIRVSAGAGKRTRELLDAKGLKIPALDGLSDEQAHERLQEMLMVWISKQRGQENGVPYAEVFYYMDEWHGVPGLSDYIQANVVER